MAPPTSPAWQYFTVQEHGMAKCHLCHKFIRIIRNTSPLVAHLRCKHPEVFESGRGEEEIKDQVEMEDASTQTSAEDFSSIKSEDISDMEFDMRLRVREIMASRLEDAVGKQDSMSPEPMVDLVKILCESSLWMLRDWPGQKMDNYNSVRGSRMDALGRLRTMLRRRPPKNCELDGLIVLLSDAVLTISEQWPGGEPDTSPVPAPLPRPPSHHHTPVLSSLLSAPSTSLCSPTPPKMPRITARQYPVPKAPHAGGASLLWRYFLKVSDESGQPLAKCTICGKIVARHNSGTTCMKNHLFASHPTEYSALGNEAAAIFSNPSQSSSPGVSSVETEPVKKVGNGTAKKEGTNLNSAIIAALNGSGSPLESSTSPLFNNGTVKEEELDIDETLNQFSASFAYNEASTSQSELTTADVLRPKGSGSDIWTYFTKGEENGERFGCCTLCDWKGKTYNYGTNNMWSHLKRTHPAEYTVLKPFEHNPAVHGQIYFGAGNLGSAVVPSGPAAAAGGTIVVTPGAPIPAHLTLPREPSLEDGLVDGEVKEEEEEQLFD